MKLKDLIFEQDSQVPAAAKAINDAIISIDDSMHYEVFAKAVGLVLKDEYGDHNIKGFMSTLSKQLGINEQSVNEDLQSKLEQGLKSLAKDYSPFISITPFNQDRPKDDPLKGKGLGIIRFRVKTDIPKDILKKASEVIKSHGGTITSIDHNYEEEQDRINYPEIKFHISL